MPFLGTTPVQGFVSSFPKQSFTPNGSTTVFTLTNPVATANDLEVFVGNVRQEPTTAYTAAGTTLTMSEAPASGLNFYVINKSFAQVTTTPPTNSISTDKIVNSAITDAKIATMASSKLTGTVSNARFPAGAVIQVKSTTFSATAAVAADTSSHSWKDTAIAVSITPISTSSKIYISVHLSYCYNVGGENVYLRLKRNSTGIATGDAAGNRTSVSVATTNPSGSRMKAIGFNHLDSPNSTSAQTYTLQVTGNNASGYIYINATNSDTDAFYRPRGVSTITVMEIAG